MRERPPPWGESVPREAAAVGSALLLSGTPAAAAQPGHGPRRRHRPFRASIASAGRGRDARGRRGLGVLRRDAAERHRRHGRRSRRRPVFAAHCPPAAVSHMPRRVLTQEVASRRLPPAGTDSLLRRSPLRRRATVLRGAAPSPVLVPSSPRLVPSSPRPLDLSSSRPLVPSPFPSRLRASPPPRARDTSHAPLPSRLRHSDAVPHVTGRRAGVACPHPARRRPPRHRPP